MSVITSKTTRELQVGDKIKVGDPVHGPWSTVTITEAPKRAGAEFDVEYDQPIMRFEAQGLIGLPRTHKGAVSKAWEVVTPTGRRPRTHVQEQADLRTERAERVRLGAHG